MPLGQTRAGLGSARPCSHGAARAGASEAARAAGGAGGAGAAVGARPPRLCRSGPDPVADAALGADVPAPAAPLAGELPF